MDEIPAVPLEPRVIILNPGYFCSHSQKMLQTSSLRAIRVMFEMGTRRKVSGKSSSCYLSVLLIPISYRFLGVGTPDFLRKGSPSEKKCNLNFCLSISLSLYKTFTEKKCT